MSNVKKNILYNIAYQILAIIVPFITSPYLARVIGANGVGVYSFSHSIALYFTYFALLGLTNYGNRMIAEVQNNYEMRSKLFSEIYIMQVVCSLISILVYTIYTFTFANDINAAIIMGLTVLSAAFDINWFFFGMEKFKLTVVRNTLIKVLTAIAIFLFVKDSDDIYIYIFIMAIGSLASQIYLWVFLKKYVKFEFPKWKEVKKHFKPNLILFVPVIAVSIYKIMDKVLLGYMSSMEQVGYYENAERVITIAVTMITAVGTVMLPRMTSLIADNKIDKSRQYIDKTMLVVMAYTNAVMFGIFGVASQFAVLYYGEAFLASGVIMCYLSITVVFLGCGNVVRTQYLIPNKMDKIYLSSAILGAIVNFVINLLLIPRYNATGAAIGTVCAEASVCLYQIISVRKNLNLKKYIKWEVVFGILGLIMFVTIKVVPVPNNQFWALLIRIVVGMIVYVFLAGIYVVKVEQISFARRKTSKS